MCGIHYIPCYSIQSQSVKCDKIHCSDNSTGEKIKNKKISLLLFYLDSGISAFRFWEADGRIVWKGTDLSVILLHQPNVSAFRSNLCMRKLL